MANYGVRGSSIYSKALLTASVTRWLDLYGQFLYSQPDDTVNYQQTAAGNLFQQNQLLFYSAQMFLLSAESKMPHTTGSAGAEIRPLHNVRILQSWLTDRLHNAAQRRSDFTGPGFSATAVLGDRVVAGDQLQPGGDDRHLGCTVALDGARGVRRVWGDASDAITGFKAG